MNLKYAVFLFIPLFSVLAEPLRLSNDFWDIKIAIDSGAKASSIVYKPCDKELVNTWRQVQLHGSPVQMGGAWGGHMGGSYNDEQGTTPYQVRSSGSDRLESSWSNDYPDFAGLREYRTVTLDGPRINVKLKIINQSTQPRTFMYRLQDFISTRNAGQSQFGVIPGTQPEIFRLNDPNRRERIFPEPAAEGLAICDIENDFGLLVTCRGQINGLYTWSAQQGNSATVEFFMKQTQLAPGASWEAEFVYQAFTPSNPAELPELWQTQVKPQHIHAAMNRPSNLTSPLPYHAVCRPGLKPDQLQIFPVTASDNAAGKNFPAAHKMSLQSMKIFGTPGERVDFVWALKAGAADIQSQWRLNGFSTDGSPLDGGEWQLHYLTQDGYYLVRDQRLTDKNKELAVFGNSLSDTKNWSDLNLSPGKTAWVKISYQIPPEAVPGRYESTIEIAGKAVQVSLNVLPFRLNRENAKTFGSFFRVFTTAEKPQWSMSREEFHEALRFASANWNNGIFIYVNNPADLRWSIDRLHSLGWRNAVICPISRILPPGDIEKLQKDYSYRILTWGVDEPATYQALGIAAKRLRILQDTGYRQPAFTPSTFMGMLFADLYPEYIPVFNTNGMMTVLMEKSRRYAADNRLHFWYSCPTGMLSAREQLKERLLHGVYLWKMPVGGIFDWGEDVAAATQALGAYCGFAGKKFLSTIRRDNSYEGYKDYLYLKTLAETVNAGSDTPVSAEAREFLNDLAHMLDDNYYNAVARFDHVFLDSIRGRAAQLTSALISANGKRTPPAPIVPCPN